MARELGTGRTAAACLAQYQRCHNAALLQSKWTPDDAARLAGIVTRLGTNWTVRRLYSTPSIVLSTSTLLFLLTGGACTNVLRQAIKEDAVLYPMDRHSYSRLAHIAS